MMSLIETAGFKVAALTKVFSCVTPKEEETKVFLFFLKEGLGGGGGE